MPEATTATDESGMDDAFYADDSEGSEKEAPESIDEEESKYATALIPTSALGESAKKGDMITMKVVKVYGDEVEVELSSSRENNKTESQTPSEELDEMDSMKG